MDYTERTFLEESNKIEGVFDEDSFVDACNAWEYLDVKPFLTIENILKTHKILMARQDLPDKYKGAFRDCDVYVGGRMGAAPELLDDLMREWLEAATHSTDFIEMHVRFEQIHPFCDGNGRMGRILYNWFRKAHGKGVRVFFEKDKQKYYRWFK